MKRINRLTSLLLVVCLSVAPAFGAVRGAVATRSTSAATRLLPRAVLTQQPVAKPQTVAELQARISALLDQPKFAAARWGVLVKAGQDKIIFERDADKAFMPASNMKLYTTSAALDAFGSGFKIKTSVYATKPAKAGRIVGDLILYGRGDPNLSPRFEGENSDRYDDHVAADKIAPIERLAEQIRAAGVKTITGDLIGDDSYFADDLIGPGWEWDDLQFYYGAEVSALTVNDNCVSFTVKPGAKVGDKPKITVQPETEYIKIVNNATTAANGASRVGVNRPLNSNTFEFFGSIPRNREKFEINVAIHNPAMFAATLLKEALARRGIRVLGKTVHADAVARVAKPFYESKLIEIAKVESQPMSEILKVVNKESQNLHTELLLRQLGAASVKEPGGQHELDEYGRPKTTLARGNEARRQFLQKAGVDVVPLSLRDGSGLARQDLITPRATARLLEFMLTHPHFNVFRESLGIAGTDGTLERRMRDTAAAGNFRGKTGTLSYVNALSGYVTTKRGQVVVISSVGNNFVGPGREVTAVLDQICVMLAEFEGEL
ncbi:MAG: D-alanyl-D-alanine carboxypeptidase/D-alanyl-D-alanine-endopeptidase [Acidobacteria bacterium]|nr:D-alanyl-D-alanine carboxypeptidase/D-alanyl-D-alanine-endopeptidase [Acidobacteriota bacterium]